MKYDKLIFYLISALLFLVSGCGNNVVDQLAYYKNRKARARLENKEDFILLLARRERMVNPMAGCKKVLFAIRPEMEKEGVSIYSGEGATGKDLSDALSGFFGDHVQIVLYKNSVTYYFNTALGGKRK